MYIKIRKITDVTPENDTVIIISKKELIKELEKRIEATLKIPIGNQRLFYKGKQLARNYRIMDYGININDVIQLMIKQETEQQKVDKNIQKPENNYEIEVKHIYYKIGDEVDFRNLDCAFWLEATITHIRKSTKYSDAAGQVEEILFYVKDPYENTSHVLFENIRPRSRHTYKFSDLHEGQEVMVNYNITDSSLRGHWYDMRIDKIKKYGIRKLVGTINLGSEMVPLTDCNILLIDEIMRIEKATLLTEREEINVPIPLRDGSYYCIVCRDIPEVPCACTCTVCGSKENPINIIFCNECYARFHIFCLSPALESLPDTEWYCPTCKNDDEIVKVGDKLVVNRKRTKMPSANKSYKGRNWGHGMACVGRSKTCIMVPMNHFGPIPGIFVGTTWKFRMQVSEAGVHRPPVAGIHGAQSRGAYSLVLSGGYEDNVDNGEEFVYTGTGGRDLSGNKRTAKQSSDQELTLMNMALARNCNAEFNDTEGAESKDWKAGKPVRVVRNDKLAKYSKYAPKDGNRYDGIYKVVKYFPEKGKSGFLIWRFLLKRDDPVPAPWTKNGQEFDVIYPPGYLEAQENKSSKKPKRANRKRPLTEKTSSKDKKPRMEKFTLTEGQSKLIQADKQNKQLWDECAEYLDKGKLAYVTKIQQVFICICCQDVVCKPITTSCKHNMCLGCLKRSFSAQNYTCPYCRKKLGKKYKMNINKPLSEILLDLMKGYDNNREDCS